MLSADTYNLWFAPLRACGQDNNTLLLEVANDFCEVWLKDNYMDLLQQVVGIASGRDALEFLAAGATAVQVGTATFVEPEAATRVLVEMRAWLAAHGIARVVDLVGAFRAEHAQEASRSGAARNGEQP